MICEHDLKMQHDLRPIKVGTISCETPCMRSKFVYERRLGIATKVEYRDIENLCVGNKVVRKCRGTFFCLCLQLSFHQFSFLQMGKCSL